MSMNILGLDPSTSTGVSLLHIPDEGQSQLLISREINLMSDEIGVPRAIAIKNRLHQALKDATDDHPEEMKPYQGWVDLAVMEGYGYANKYSLVCMVEIGTLLRVFLIEQGIPLEVVAPKKLKKFVTGRGNATKEAMVAIVKERWGHKCVTHNIADAVGLSYYGGWILGRFQEETDLHHKAKTQ